MMMMMMMLAILRRPVQHFENTGDDGRISGATDR